MSDSVTTPHFNNKDAITHVIEKRAEGVIALSEAHGMEIPGHYSAAADAIRETSLALLLIFAVSQLFLLPQPITTALLIGFSVAWVIWKTGRSAWLAWSRLERLHRLVEQEKYEIENNREQEREELTALYRAKGFEGKLLKDAIDVLMADEERLLRVMLEEELGLTLEAHEHPLKQSLGAFLGSFIAATFLLTSNLFFPSYGILLLSFVLISVGAAISAIFEKNRLISAIVWNVSIGALSLGFLYFISQIFVPFAL